LPRSSVISDPDEFPPLRSFKYFNLPLAESFLDLIEIYWTWSFT